LDDEIITNSGSYTVTINAAASVNKLTTGGGATVSLTGGSMTFVGQSLVSALVISGGDLICNGNSLVTNLTQSGGAVRGFGVLSVAGNLTWTGGEMTGIGTTYLLPGSSATLTGSDTKSLYAGRCLQNGGTLLWQQGTIGFDTASIASVSNLASGVIDITVNNAHMIGNRQAVIIDNAGLIRRSSGTGFVILNLDCCSSDGTELVQNRGTIEVLTGTLGLTTFNRTAQHTGNFIVAPGASLQFRGNGIQNVTTAIGVAGRISMEAGLGTVNLNGGLSAGTLEMLSGTLNVQGTSSVGAIAASGGNLRCDAATSVTNLALNGGIIGGTNVLSVVSNLTWTSGIMSEHGTTLLLPGSSSLVTGPDGKELRGRNFANAGTLSWQQSNIGLGDSSTGSASVSNLATGVIEISLNGDPGNGRLLGCGNSWVIDNAGRIRRSSGTGHILLGYNACSGNNNVLHNRGVIEVQTGIVQVRTHSGISQHSGSFVVAPGAQLLFSGDSAGIQNVTSAVNVAGKIWMEGSTVNLLGGLVVPILDVTGGTFNLQSPSTIGVATNSGGTLNFNDKGIVTNLALISGVIGGTNVLDVVSNLTWIGGIMNENGTTRLLAGSTAILTGPDVRELRGGRSLANGGTLLWQQSNIGFGDASTGNNCSISNLASGVMEITLASGRMEGCNNTAIIDNAGLIRRSVGTGLVTLGSRFGLCGGTYPLINRGTIEVQNGRFALGTKFTQTGGSMLLSGGDASTSILDIQGGTLAGVGTVTGTVTNNGLVSPGTSPGLLTIDGDYSQTAAGALNIEIAGPVPGVTFDKLAVTGNASLAGKVNVVLTNGFYPTTNNTFTFLSAASVAGPFGVFNYPSNDVGMKLSYAIVSVTIQVTNVIPPTPALLGAPAYGPNDRFEFTVTGTSNRAYAIQVSTNLADINWMSIFTNISPFTYQETNDSNFPRRFYRAVSSP
jgi:hypothetical protein